MDAGMDREYTYRLPLSGLAFVSIMAVLLLAAAGMAFMMLVGGSVALPGGRGGLVFWGVPAPVYQLWIPGLFLVLGLGCVAQLARRLLLERHGRVHATGVGITIRNWTGREWRAFWEEVDELEVSGPAGGLDRGFSKLWLRCRGERIGVQSGLEGIEDLRDQIVARAELTLTKRDGWGSVYAKTRAGSTPQSAQS